MQNPRFHGERFLHENMEFNFYSMQFNLYSLNILCLAYFQKRLCSALLKVHKGIPQIISST